MFKEAIASIPVPPVNSTTGCVTYFDATEFQLHAISFFYFAMSSNYIGREKNTSKHCWRFKFFSSYNNSTNTRPLRKARHQFGFCFLEDFPPYSAMLSKHNAIKHIRTVFMHINCFLSDLCRCWGRQILSIHASNFFKMKWIL